MTADELLNGTRENSAKSNGGFNGVNEYLVNRAIVRLKVVAILSTFLAVVGLVLPYFIWLEEKNLTAIFFGIWFEICSAGLFLAYYAICNNEIKSYNRYAKEKINNINLRNKYLRFLLMLWLVLPAVFVGYVACEALTLSLTMTIFGIVIIYIVSCFLALCKLRKNERNEKK